RGRGTNSSRIDEVTRGVAEEGSGSRRGNCIAGRGIASGYRPACKTRRTRLNRPNAVCLVIPPAAERVADDRRCGWTRSRAGSAAAAGNAVARRPVERHVAFRCADGEGSQLALAVKAEGQIRSTVLIRTD